MHSQQSQSLITCDIHTSVHWILYHHEHAFLTLWIVTVPPYTMKIDIIHPLGVPITSERPLTDCVRFPLWFKEFFGGFSPDSPQDIYWREIPLGIPGEGRGGRLVEVAHQEDHDGADKEHGRHDNKADPVDHPGNQEPLLILLGLRESTDYTNYVNLVRRRGVNIKIDLTFWKLFCCLAVSAICLQETTHFFTSGEAFARLVLSCSAVPPSSPSSVFKCSRSYRRRHTSTCSFAQAK